MYLIYVLKHTSILPSKLTLLPKDVMTKRELLKVLREAGFEKIRQGGSHEIWGNSKINFPIPRHKGEIPKGTAEKILKQAGLK